jgi:plastin-1
LGFIWQAIKAELLGRINLKQHPELIRLLNKGEDMHDLLASSPEQILKRWFNYHLKKTKLFYANRKFWYTC